LRELAVVVLVPLLLVLPWAIGTLATPAAWLVEAGRAGAIPSHVGLRELLLGRAGGPAEAPAWIGAGLPLAGLVALVRRDTRPLVLRVWVVVLAAALVLVLVSRVPVALPGVPVEFRAWPGFLVLLIQAGFVTAATIAADGAATVVSRMGFGWRQPVAAVAVAGALATTVLGAGWWVLRGGQGPLERAPVDSVPTYMQELAADNDTHGVLVLTGGLRRGIDYQLLRSGVSRLGDDGVLALTQPDSRFTALVTRLVSDPAEGDARELASYGVKYVYAPAPVSATVSGGLDSADGLGGASAPARGSRAWVVQEPTTLTSLARDRATWRPLWVTVDVLALLTCLVLAAPERRRRR
jgi:hypothetical protein